MAIKLKLGVYRRLDNRFENLPDDSPRGLELHYRRRDALHAALDEAPGLRVTNWGQTDDTRSHEFVELILQGFATAAVPIVVVPGLLWLGKKLAEKAVDTVVGESVKHLYVVLFDKQKKEEILDYTVKLPDGTLIHVDPLDRQAEIRVTFKDGKVESFKYSRRKGK